VLDYLDGLKWDGKTRIDRWLTTYGGADDTPYVSAVGRIMLVAAARRVRRPGCKFDEMPTFESPQGKDKSTALKVLAVEEDWFSDDLPLTADSQKVIEQTTGRWIVEVAELSGMRKANVEHLKSFLSRQVDRSRMAYGRLTTEKKREFIVVGTTNETAYLKDLTGNRRYWPVKTPIFDLAALRRDRDQLWAEAAAHEAAGETASGWTPLCMELRRPSRRSAP
jgi:predicted P-loop ATPase